MNSIKNNPGNRLAFWKTGKREPVKAPHYLCGAIFVACKKDRPPDYMVYYSRNRIA